MAFVNIKQEKKKLLMTFMKHFGKVVLNIQNLNPVVAMHHLITTLQSRLFVSNLRKKPTSNLDELQTRVAKYM